MMGFTAAPWGLDGARSPASLARLANRAAVKQSGIINAGDLKVLPLSTPGNGVRIVSGGAVLENRYEADVNQAYVVEATSEEILDAADNFTGITSQGSTQSHLICVTVGDPNYSTAGHAWLTDGNKPVTAEAKLDYQYVRPWVIKNVPAGTVRVEDLPAPPTFPCYAVARIDVPASTTAITSGMIIDLREVVNRRQKEEQWNVAIAVADPLNVSGNYVYEIWPDNSMKNIYVPKWATRAYITAWIYSFSKNSNILTDAAMRVAMYDGGSRVAYAQQSVFYDPTIAGGGRGPGRYEVLMGAPMEIPSSARGTTRTFCTEATYANAAAMALSLTTDSRTSVMISLRFSEEAV
jgi:hypothetical protein